MEQRTDEWFAARLGKITASRMHDVMALGEGGYFKSGPRKGQPRPPGKARSDYALQLAAERITGKAREQISAKPMERGRLLEPDAITAYEVRAAVLVQPCGFVQHPAHDFIGASPDFLVDTLGGGEVKCPFSPEVHLQTLREGLPPEHIEQIQGGLWVTGRAWWDFVSYHPDFPEPLCLYVQRVHRDEICIAAIAEACITLEDEVRAIVAEFTERIAA